MKKILFVWLAYFLVGCSAPVYDIDLKVADNSTGFNNVTVLDKRADTKVYMTETGVDGKHTYMLEVKPPLNTTLEGLVKSEILNTQLNADVDINIQNLEIRRQVRFASPDDLFCVIESGVIMGKSAEPTPVKSTTKNDDDGTTSISIIGKLIIDQCLVAHARDLAKYIKQSEK